MWNKLVKAFIVHGDLLIHSVSPLICESINFRPSDGDYHSFLRRSLVIMLMLLNSPIYLLHDTDMLDIINGFLKLLLISSTLQIANIFTKPLHHTTFHGWSKVSRRNDGRQANLPNSPPSVSVFSFIVVFSLFKITSVLQLNELLGGRSAEVVALELLKLLGLEEGKVLDNDHYDLVFFHVGAGEQEVVAADVGYLDALVGGIMSQAQPGSDIGSRLHLSAVMSYGSVLEGDDSKFPVSKRVDEKNSHLSVLYPLQSYGMKGGIPRKDVRSFSPMLIAQWQYAVTRKDNAERFSFEDFMERGGNLTIPADRFLHEIAFKLWKAPKYGA
ncbi:uncharacterized protein HKW66_Vig0223550 [Vigna angularis]|uniref:Uncharacterized protein n=1 Tax=Phaseolus angularis TaxID=3914 RepID=A0A8T0K0L1_PHAAN|nr:uncharacterized protein HKW66_Vig0223550 [Vigna angularis]